MLWEGRPLRDVRDADVRRIVESGLEEHLQLEYKGALYDDTDRGRREFLLDTCMFANAAGAIILIGVPERRDGQGQPTGVPDSEGVLGLEVPNPASVLTAYDARVMEAIEERLPLESASIDVGEGRRVLAIRIPNSPRKPHSVWHQGHIYFPSRRERQRFHLTVREIKEIVMRTASRLEQAEHRLQNFFVAVRRSTNVPYLMIGIIPIFSEDFLVDLRAENVRRALTSFSRTASNEYSQPVYTFDGLERREARFEYTVRFGHSGLLTSSFQLPLFPQRPGEANQHVFGLTAVDSLLRNFAIRATTVYEAAGIGGPYVLGMMLRTQDPLVGAYNDPSGFGVVHTAPVPAGDYRFPFTQVDDLSETDRVIRPLCDQSHQMFGDEGSPSFNAEGAWIGR
jgi:hypothetical protein